MQKVPLNARLFETRHPETHIGQCPLAVSLGHFLDIAADSADKVNVACFQEVEESVTDRTADDDLDLELFDLAGTLVNGIAFQRNGSADDPPFPDRLKDAKPGAGVQDRRNTAPEHRYGSPRKPWNQKPAGGWWRHRPSWVKVVGFGAKNAGLNRQGFPHDRRDTGNELRACRATTVPGTAAKHTLEMFLFYIRRLGIEGFFIKRLFRHMAAQLDLD